MKTEKKSVYLSVRCEKPLREAFVATCKENDESANQVIRKYMRAYIASKGQKNLI
jgi:hypothetical protein